MPEGSTERRTHTLQTTTGIEDSVEEFFTTGGTTLRYDSSGIGQFIQNWQTPKKLGCFKVTMTTQDGSTLSALFKLK